MPLCTGEERLKQDGKKLHPTQKPEALIARAILAASRPDDLVLDPFAGTGTTGAVAKRLRRRFVGVRAREAIYARRGATADRRCQAAGSRHARAVHDRARGAARAIHRADRTWPCSTPGAILVDDRRRVKALVRADGAISLGDKVGSIHRVGALAQGLEACNGWTFWHVETGKGLVSIDALRAEVRAEMGAN